MLQAQLLAEGACYTSLLNRRTVVLNLLHASHRLFAGATIIQHLDALAPHIYALRTGLGDEGRRALYELITSFDPQVLDALRIATCFENLYKARLLKAGFVVHKIEKVGGCTHLAQAQRERPIRVGELKRAESLVGRRSLDYAFRSLSSRTLGWKTFATAAYKRALKLPDRLSECVNRVTAQRNTLHFLADGGIGSYNEKVIEDLRYMTTACNRYVVAEANRLLDSFGFPSARHLATVG